MLFSIIIPAFNCEEYIEASLQSALQQSIGNKHFEVILIDDASEDSTLKIASRLKKQNRNLITCSNEKNQGPGIARNVGIQKASGDWLIFLDSDDLMAPKALEKLAAFIYEKKATFHELICFNASFQIDGNRCVTFRTPGNPNFDNIVSDKDKLLKAYLSLHMDGSALFIAIPRSLIKNNGIFFSSGLHEDVDLLFKIYWHCTKVLYVDEVLYYKNSRDGSIIRTVSIRHIDGFMRAWSEIGHFLISLGQDQWLSYRPYYRIGYIGALATRVREIFRHAQENNAAELYECLHLSMAIFEEMVGSLQDSLPKTKYGQIVSKFVDTMAIAGKTVEEKTGMMTSYMSGIVDKTWGCGELRHSLFLAPDQIRTCCKRFFVDGEMRGDVSLIDFSGDHESEIGCQQILNAKKRLIFDINAGNSCACDGCPFLEFKEWPSLHNLDVRYLSMEHHSVCNLKCTYCSELFYDGKRARYNVNALVNSLLENDSLDNCQMIVWGGGEPLLDSHFGKMIETLKSKLPEIRQRVLTNAVAYSKTIDSLLKKDSIDITTSIDAGTEETFRLIRGKPYLKQVLRNLQKYAQSNAKRITIKYIFTEGNSSFAEIKAFVSQMKRFNLLTCNFQISSDFTIESVSIENAVLMIALHGLLNDADCRVVFADDLLRKRLEDVNPLMERYILTELSKLGLMHAVADKKSYSSVVIWGAGWQADYLLRKTSFFKKVKVAFLVDSTPSKIGGKLSGKAIMPPESLINSNLPICIAAVQGYPEIYNSYLKLGIETSRLIKQFIL